MISRNSSLNFFCVILPTIFCIGFSILGSTGAVQDYCRGNCCMNPKSMLVLMDGKAVGQDGTTVCWGCSHRTTLFFSPICNTTRITGSCKFSWYFLSRSFDSQTFTCDQLKGDGIWSCPLIRGGQKYNLEFQTEIADLSWGDVTGQYICNIQDDDNKVIAALDFPCKVTSKQKYFH